jgi:hypothetical protein
MTLRPGWTNSTAHVSIARAPLSTVPALHLLFLNCHRNETTMTTATYLSDQSPCFNRLVHSASSALLSFPDRLTASTRLPPTIAS